MPGARYEPPATKVAGGSRGGGGCRRPQGEDAGARVPLPQYAPHQAPGAGVGVGEAPDAGPFLSLPRQPPPM